MNITENGAAIKNMTWMFPYEWLSPSLYEQIFNYLKSIFKKISLEEGKRYFSGRNKDLE